MLWDGIARRAFGLGGGGPNLVGSSGGAGTGMHAVVERGVPRPKLGLALGGGAARGWSHIGVLQVLAAAGLVPDIVAGSSIGAVAGGCYAAGKLKELEEFARSLTRRRVIGLLDFQLGGSGLIGGERVRRLLEAHLADQRIETLPLGFVTVATELGTGHEIWLTRGALVEALRASYALPGIFEPVRLGGRWLMDGALVNPIPITAARALGADVVVCVNLNGDIRVRGTVIQSHSADLEMDVPGAVVAEVTSQIAGEVPAGDSPPGEPRRWSLFGPMREAAGRMRARVRRPRVGPGIAGVMVDAFNITQDRIARSRLAGDPPDVMISPKLAQVGLFDFHRAEECIELGRQAAERALPDIREMLRPQAQLA